MFFHAVNVFQEHKGSISSVSNFMCLFKVIFTVLFLLFMEHTVFKCAWQGVSFVSDNETNSELHLAGTY